MTVELIYDRDCPNVCKARAVLIKSLAASGQKARWTEWERSDPDCPPHVKGFGSPTILVNGLDVAGEQSNKSSDSCRLYRDEESRFNGAPSVEQIVAALRSCSNPSTAAPRRSSGWKSSLATVPGIAVALLPKLACPACWPAYAGLLSSVGLGRLLDTIYLLPLTVAFLVIALGALVIGARSRRGYGPFFLGLASSSVVMLGKFVFESDTAMYVGITMLVSASIWNAWPLREKRSTCLACNFDSSLTVPH